MHFYQKLLNWGKIKNLDFLEFSHTFKFYWCNRADFLQDGKSYQCPNSAFLERSEIVKTSRNAVICGSLRIYLQQIIAWRIMSSQNWRIYCNSLFHNLWVNRGCQLIISNIEMDHANILYLLQDLILFVRIIELCHQCLCRWDN